MKVDSFPRVDSPTLIITSGDDHDSFLLRKCKLLAVNGPLQGEDYIVNRETFTLGSGPNNDMVLRDSTISRQHSEIQIIPDGYIIRDLGSTNGTYVRGVRVTEAFLEAGAEFRLGSTTIVFCPLRESMEVVLSKSELRNVSTNTRMAEVR